jgi:hypothetical protein
MNLKISKNEPICSCDGSIILTVSNGSPPYTYSIDNGVTLSNLPIFSNLCSGTYSVQVTDNDGAIINSSITLSDPPIPITYSVLLEKTERIIVNDGITKTKLTEVSIRVEPELPNGAYITFDLTHTNILETSPVYSAASLSTNSVLTQISPFVPIFLSLPEIETNIPNSFSETTTGSTNNTYPGCQNQPLYFTTFYEVWNSLQIYSGVTYVLQTSSTTVQNINDNCLYINDTDSYSVVNTQIFNCSCCSVIN